MIMVLVILFSNSPVDSVGFIAKLESPPDDELIIGLSCELKLEPGFNVHPGELISCPVQHVDRGE